MDQQSRKEQGETLAALLTDIRTQHGHSQQWLADRVGLQQTAISKIERGQKEPSFLEVRDLCAAMNVSLTDFIRALGERLGTLRRTM
jgi:transcriptional regulator with XRE-family HTH domain